MIQRPLLPPIGATAVFVLATVAALTSEAEDQSPAVFLKGVSITQWCDPAMVLAFRAEDGSYKVARGEELKRWRSQHIMLYDIGSFGGLLTPTIVGGKVVEAFPPSDLLSKGHRVEFGTLQIPHIAVPIQVAVGFEGSEIGVARFNHGAVASGLTCAFYGTGKYMDGETPGLRPVPVKTDSARTANAVDYWASFPIGDDTLRGFLYISPVKDREGAFVHPSKMFAEYFEVTDPSLGFVYDSTMQKSESARRQIEVLFRPKGLRSVAKVNVLPDGRLKFYPALAQNADSGEKERVPYMNAFEMSTLLFGRLVSPGQPWGQWVLCEQGAFDEFIAKYTEAVRSNPSDSSILADRGNVYRQIGQFAEALSDYERAGRPLRVKVVSSRAELKIGGQSVGVASLGEELTVTQTRGEWLWVDRTMERGQARGAWIHRLHVR